MGIQNLHGDGMNLATRKRLAAPVYWLGWRLIRLADKIDGKQPRK